MSLEDLKGADNKHEPYARESTAPPLDQQEESRAPCLDQLEESRAAQLDHQQDELRAPRQHHVAVAEDVAAVVSMAVVDANRQSAPRAVAVAGAAEVRSANGHETKDGWGVP